MARRKQKPSKHGEWWDRAASDAIIDSFGEYLHELPIHERQAVLAAAHAAALKDNDWDLVKNAAFNALVRTRAISMSDVSDDSPTAWRWADDTNRFPEDQLLREFGYTLTDRPNKGDVMWALPCGISHTHEEAVAYVREFQAKQRAITR